MHLAAKCRVVKLMRNALALAQRNEPLAVLNDGLQHARVYLLTIDHALASSEASFTLSANLFTPHSAHLSSSAYIWCL